LRKFATSSTTPSEALPGAEKGTPHPQLIFVNDYGLYLMSNGIPGIVPEKDGDNVIFAEGFDPRTTDFDDYWYAAQRIVGGDDFAEYLDIEQMLPIPPNADGFWITVTPQTLEYGWTLVVS
jgi:hypothetical protein